MASNRHFIVCNKNVSPIKEIIKDCLSKEWLKNLSKNDLINIEKKGYRILDITTFHKSNYLLNIFNNGYRKVSFITVDWFFFFILSI